MLSPIIYYDDYLPEWLIGGVTLKNFGDMREEINKKKLADCLGVNFQKIISQYQVHGNKISEAKPGISDIKNNGDGLITDKSFVLLIKTADCVPVIGWDSRKQIVIALHVGRIGAQNNFVTQGIKSFLKKGSKTEDLNFLLGPHIRRECYMMDLEEIIISQMLKKGVSKKNVFLINECTKCLRDKYFSHRNGDKERIGTFIKIR